MKFLKILIASLLFFSLTSCIFVNDKTKSESYDKSVEVLRCFNEKDAEGLKELFCPYTRNNDNIDAEIEAAFDFYKGESISFKFAYNGGVAGSMVNGKAVDKHIEPEIENILTDLDNTYRIYYHEYLTYEEDEKCVGITYMIIFDENSDKMAQIGEYVY